MFSAGQVAEAMDRSRGAPAYVVGSVVLLIGLVMFVSAMLKPFWDAIPVNGRKNMSVETTRS
jgi:hypothetical protein